MFENRSTVGTIVLKSVFVLLTLTMATDLVCGQDVNLAELVEQVVDVRLEGNEQYTACTIIRAEEGKLPGSIKNLKVQLSGTKKSRGIAVKKVVEIFVDGQPLDVVYDRKARCLLHSPDKRTGRLAWETETNERLSGKRRRLWKPLTADEHEAYMEKHRAFLEKTKSELSHINFRYVETQYFMFLTDLTSEEVDGPLVYLDAMYSELCKAFGVPPTHNVWCGKCVVVAFRGQKDFMDFERIMMDTDATGAQGLCHSASNGIVTFAGYQGTNGFPNVLVHETTHGFVHRYMSSARIPSWLNEGMSDWIGHEIVQSQRVPRRQKLAAEAVSRAGTLGDFFTKDRITGDEYGLASSVVEILIQRDGGNGNFKAFFDGLKVGHAPEQALKETFGLTYQELTVIYAQAIGMRSIR
jgi:hypothetical protein